MSEEWMKPSEALRRMAEAPEPTIRPMTKAEKDRIVGPSELSGEVRMGLRSDGEGTGGEEEAVR